MFIKLNDVGFFCEHSVTLLKYVLQRCRIGASRKVDDTLLSLREDWKVKSAMKNNH